MESKEVGLTTIFDSGRATKRRLRTGKLVITSGPEVGREVVVDKARFSGGRSIINDLVLTDKSVSGTHFEIIADDNGYRLCDLNSSNGTHVGDLRIREVYIKPGSAFRVGQTHIRFESRKNVVEIALSERDRFGKVIGTSDVMREIFARLEKVAQTELTCLITGETGTGKELVARGIHDSSPRRDKPFVVLDCGSIPRELIESTLFGHEKGSFTGAVGQHQGCFEQAHGGTIFLDEIGELDVTLQPRLLRVLEQREITRVGGARPIKVDVRVVAATNRDLRAEVNAGKFREDLYFRLSVVNAELPPLRDRSADIPIIAQHFLRDVSSRRGISLAFGQDAMSAITNHNWPGNVRELRNVVERAAALSDGPVITRSDLVFGRLPRTSGLVSHDLMQAGASAARHAAAKLSESESGQKMSAAQAAGKAAQEAADAIAQGPAGEAANTIASSDAAVHAGGPVRFDPALFSADFGFKQAKQSIVDAFEVAYLRALLVRHDGNITRSAQEAGLTRYHLRELLKRHQLSPR